MKMTQHGRGVQRDEWIAWAALPLVVALGLGFGWAVGGGQWLPAAMLPVLLAYAVQWVAFVPAWRLRTEAFYDLVGGSTFVAVALLAALLGGAGSPLQSMVLLMVCLWAVRLAGFLFLRVRAAGKDRRFDAIKQSFPRYLLAWTFQGLWVSFSLAPALVVLTADAPRAGAFTLVGVMFWLAGMAIEVTADWQKWRFRQDPANRGRFIQHGLWRWSRHPNYFGEILLWTGMALLALPYLQGWQWLTLLSPVMVYLLLATVSGIPILEKGADAKWGGQADYEAYKRTTPVLVPRPWRWRR